MTILAQHGSGKGQKIENGIADGTIDGMILSPHDLDRLPLEQFVESVAASYPEAERLIDPLLHTLYYRGALKATSRLPQYDYFQLAQNSPNITPSDVQRIVDLCLNWQDRLMVTNVLSPTHNVDDFGDASANVAWAFAEEAAKRYSGEKPLLLSFVVNESALVDRGAVDQWTKRIATLNPSGFYFVVNRSSYQYAQVFNVDALISLLLVCCYLTEECGFKVIVGYSDFLTLPLHSVGVTNTAAGWHQGLKQFSYRRFRSSRGGPGTDRYTSKPLLNSIYDSELSAIYNAGQINTVVSGTKNDVDAINLALGIGQRVKPDVIVRHHWEVLAQTVNSVAGRTITDRLDIATDLITRASAVYRQLASVASFSHETGPAHLQDWSRALIAFRTLTGY